MSRYCAGNKTETKSKFNLYRKSCSSVRYWAIVELKIKCHIKGFRNQHKCKKKSCLGFLESDMVESRVLFIIITQT